MNLMAEAQRRRLAARRETDCFTNKNGDINLDEDGQMRRIDRYVRYAETMEEMMFPKTVHTPSRPQPDRHVPGIDDADLEEDDDPLPDNDTSDDDTSDDDRSVKSAGSNA